MPKKWTILFLLVVTVVLLVACGNSAQPEKVIEQVTVEVPVTVIVTKEVPVTVEVVKTVQVVETVVVTATPKPVPTSTPTPELAEDESNTFAINELGVWESGGISINVRRVLCSDKDVQNARTDGDFDRYDTFAETPIVCEIVYEVKNITDKTLGVYPSQGKIQIGDEVISLLDYMLAQFGDDASGDIPPGARLIAGQWFGVKRYGINEITEMIWRFDGPHDENYHRTGKDFEIVLDLSEHRIEPIPDDLK